ncbi:MAG: hypothetical protein EXR52_06400 [Dehalococcoidia bacterium]|nr:hypothetical protein [Dehalococcoidia bacterium]
MLSRKTTHEASYERDDLTVTYNAARCIHAAACVRGLPAVFDTRMRPWINLDLGTADEIVAIVRRCRSGALQ